MKRIENGPNFSEIIVTHENNFKPTYEFDNHGDRNKHITHFRQSLEKHFQEIGDEYNVDRIPESVYDEIVSALNAKEFWKSDFRKDSNKSRKIFDNNKDNKENSGWDLFVKFIEAEAHTDLSLLDFKKALEDKIEFNPEMIEKIVSDFVFLRQLFHENKNCSVKNTTSNNE